MMLWMLYLVLVAFLVTLGALALERLLRGMGRQGRWVWLGAMALSFAIPMGAALQTGGDPAAIPFPIEAAYTTLPSGDGVSASALAAAPLATPAEPSALSAAVARVGTMDPFPASVWLTLWTLLSAGLLLFFAVGARQMSRQRRKWPMREVEGRRVHLSLKDGPAVVGVRAPAIVLPRWLLRFPAETVDTVLRHEESHAMSRDTLVLALGVGMVLVAPWNPALWYQLRRLRRAVELDCDARVLRAGISPREYGRVLLEVGAWAGRPGLPAAALLEDHRLLETRLNYLRPGATRLSRLAAVGCAVLALGALAGACGSPSPSQAPPPGNAEALAVEVGAPTQAPTVDYTPTVTLGELEFRGPNRLGEDWETEVARSLAELTRINRRLAEAEGDALASLLAELTAASQESLAELERLLTNASVHHREASELTEREEASDPAPSRPQEPFIRPDVGPPAAAEESDRVRTVRLRGGSVVPPNVTVDGVRLREATTPEDTPLLLIDGEIVEGGLSDLRPEDISQIEIVKGQAALDRWGERARRGAILVTMKDRTP